jgi:hypothetical protein
VRIAEIVEAILRAEFDIDPGPRARRDAVVGGLRVDFVYEEALPTPMALEVSSLTDSLDAAGTAEAFKMEDRLTRRAMLEGWGTWVVSVSSAARMRDLEPEIEGLIRTGRPIRPGDYNSADLLQQPESEVRRIVELHRRLERLGLVNLEPLEREGGDFVAIMSLGGAGVITGFEEGLRAVIRENAQKLGEARPRRTHLAIDVARFDASRYPHQTPPGRLPPEIDMVWVVHRYGPRTLPNVWSLARGEVEWHQHSISGGW